MTKKAKAKKKVTKSDCIGCRDNYYNQPGNSTTGECWSMKGASLEKCKFVPLDAYPPWNQPIETAPSCYRKKGYVRVRPEVTHG